MSVSATVRDSEGRLVTSLTKEDFVLKEDGKPQEIRFFSYGTKLPLTLALIVDTSGSQTPYLRSEIAAGHLFFQSMLLRPEDRATLIQIDCEVQQYSGLVSSAAELDKALDRLAERDFLTACDARNDGSRIFDGIVVTSQLESNDRLGRKAMIVLTDGGDRGSRFDEPAALREAQQDDVAIYSICYGGGIGTRKDLLEELSESTGGRTFTIGGKLTLEHILDEISTELRSQYLLAYRPPQARTSRYRTIELKVPGRKMKIRARKGYFMQQRPITDSGVPSPLLR